MSDYHIHLLPHGRQIKVKQGRNLMESLMAENIFLRSDCGGKGVCGKCQVKEISANGHSEIHNACTLTISEDISIEIPESSMLSSHIISKAPVSFPETFKNKFRGKKGKVCHGIAVDLGTTTIALYLCNMTTGEVLSSLAVKNPQALYGDDVMSRIGAIGQEVKNLERLQKLVVRAMEWAIKQLLDARDIEPSLSQMVVVGNPTMIHILAGVDPKSIGISPYQPAFYDARKILSADLGFGIGNLSTGDLSIQTLPQVSGFIGGDILGAGLAVDFDTQPCGTLLIDLGTNGELLLKGKDRLFATSCATGPAFEGASLSCGMQAIPGAVNRVEIKELNEFPHCSFINPSNSSKLKPSGICGTGVISAVVQLWKNNIIEPGGAFRKDLDLLALKKDSSGKMQYTIVPEALTQDGGVFISQKDIRSVQLGKAALISGIEFLLREAGFEKPEKIIIAGAFGTFLDKEDMMGLGMIPVMDLDRVEVAGNSAGAGAVMALCDEDVLEKSKIMAARITTVDLACNQDFQEVFVERLSFPDC